MNDPRESESIYKPDPEAETGYVVGSFFRALEALAPPSAVLVVATLEARTEELQREHARRALNELSRHNLRYACAVLAGFEALAGALADAAAVSLLRDAFRKSGEFVRQKTGAWLDASADPFRDLVAISKEREKSQFGPGFHFERTRDDEEAYLLVVRKCFWHDFFLAVGHPALTSVLCEFDANWIGAIVPERHGFRFDRPTTLGYGGTHCPFHFRRLR